MEGLVQGKQVPEIKTEGGDDGECVICMENEATQVLECFHSFCENCLRQWSEKSITCPVCRSNTNIAGGEWVLTEQPSNEEFSNFFNEYIHSIAAQK